jgi:hypothetical protein
MLLRLQRLGPSERRDLLSQRSDFAEKQHNLALGSQESTITVLQMVGGLWESKTRCTNTIPNTSECHGDFAEKQHNLALGSQESTITVLQMVGGLWESKARCTNTIPSTSECNGVMGADRNMPESIGALSCACIMILLELANLLKPMNVTSYKGIGNVSLNSQHDSYLLKSGSSNKNNCCIKNKTTNNLCSEKNWHPRAKCAVFQASMFFIRFQENCGQADYLVQPGDLRLPLSSWII